MNPLNPSLLSDLVASTVQGDFEHVQRLLSLGVPPDVIDLSSGWSALHACVLHHPSHLESLLASSTDPDAPWVAGGTPLSYVVHELGEQPDENRRLQLLHAIELLLKAGANPKCGESDQTAVSLAVQYQMPEVLSALSSANVKGGPHAT